MAPGKLPCSLPFHRTSSFWFNFRRCSLSRSISVPRIIPKLIRWNWTLYLVKHCAKKKLSRVKLELTINQGICEFPHAVVYYDTCMGELVECDIVFFLQTALFVANPATPKCKIVVWAHQKRTRQYLSSFPRRRDIFCHKNLYSICIQAK